MKEGGDAAGKHGRRWWKNRRGGRLLSVWGVVSRCAGLRRTKNIQVLNDGSLITFSTSFLLISYTFLSANLILFNLCPAPPLFIFITSSMHTPPPPPPIPTPTVSSYPNLSQTPLLLQSILSLRLDRGKLSANEQFYFCNLHPPWQTFCGPFPPLPTTLAFTAARPSWKAEALCDKRATEMGRKSVWAAVERELIVKTTCRYSM